MAAFLKSLSRFLTAGKHAPAVYLAAFGKHPGWNDHIDDLGLDTDALINAKRLLYVLGISQNIDAGAWEALEPPASGRSIVSGTARLDAFRHDLLWYPGGNTRSSLLAGRLWSSVDGKGRDKYPMVLCAHCIDLPDQFAAGTILPFLAKVHARCEQARTADDVRAVLDSERANLQALIKSPSPPGTPPSPAEPLSPNQLAAIANHPDMLPNREGFHRIIYQFVRRMSFYRSDSGANSAIRSAAHRAEQIRVPVCGMAPPDALLFWLRCALTLLDPATPILLLAPDQGVAAPWVDIIVGEPAPANLFCLKAGTKSLPLTSEIPYTLDPAFTAAIDKFISTCINAPDNTAPPPWPAL